MLPPIRNKTNSISPSVSANRSENQNGKTGITSVASNQRVPFAEIQQHLPYQPCSRTTYTEMPSEMPFKFMRTNDDKMIPSNSAMAQKENVNYFGQYAPVVSFEKMLKNFCFFWFLFFAQIMPAKQMYRSLI